MSLWAWWTAARWMAYSNEVTRREEANYVPQQKPRKEKVKPETDPWEEVVSGLQEVNTMLDAIGQELKREENPKYKKRKEEFIASFKNRKKVSRKWQAYVRGEITKRQLDAFIKNHA